MSLCRQFAKPPDLSIYTQGEPRAGAEMWGAKYVTVFTFAVFLGVSFATDFRGGLIFVDPLPGGQVRDVITLGNTL